MAGAPQTLGALGALVQQLREDFERHDARDDLRFEASRKDHDESTRRLYERMEARFGEMGLKVDTVVTKVVQQVQDLNEERIRAEGYADGLKEAKTPSPTRIAIVQGVAGDVAKLIMTLIVVGAMAMAGGWQLERHVTVTPAAQK